MRATQGQHNVETVRSVERLDDISRQIGLNGRAMLDRKLIDLMNTGNAIAVVGSGPSNDAGLPSWSGLYDTIAMHLEAEGVVVDAANDLRSKWKLPEALQALQDATSEEQVRNLAVKEIERHTMPGRFHHAIANWPFKAYLTLNYDHLLEDAAQAPLVSIGNRGSELHKLQGNEGGFVWHVHGSARLSSDRSRIVLTKSDYDELYPSSNCVETAKHLLATHRAVFFGFGFNDEDFLRLLDHVARIGSGSRPVYAFVPHDPAATDEQRRNAIERLRTKFNVECVTYRSTGKDHSDLARIIDAYDAFIVRRSVSFGRLPSSTPEYDPGVSSLRVQAGLDLVDLDRSQTGLKSTLVSARVLAHVTSYPKATKADLVGKLASPPNVSEEDVSDAIVSLQKNRLLSGGPNFVITDVCRSKRSSLTGRVHLARDKFGASIKIRAKRAVDESSFAGVVVSSDTVEKNAMLFFEEVCRTRGLGIAQNLVQSTGAVASLRAVAILQAIEPYLAACANRDEAVCLVRVVSDVLSSATTEESNYLGMLCQAYFGTHLLGVSREATKLDEFLISSCVYLLDASVLICLLASGSRLNESYVSLVDGLTQVGAKLVTTDLLVDEIVEHANWAIRLMQKHGEDSPVMIDVLQGRSGYRNNEFVSGYFYGRVGESGVGFLSYLSEMFGARVSGPVNSDIVSEALSKKRVEVRSLSDWNGYTQAAVVERDELSARIALRRRANNTWRHDRQVQAEAEVALVVSSLRRGTLALDGTSADAFFVSGTRVVDNLEGIEKRITISATALTQWIWSSRDPGEHADHVFEQLLLDLANSGVEFVNKQVLLRRFSGVTAAAEAELKLALQERREILTDIYGEDPQAAFQDVDPLDMPRVLSEHQRREREAMIKRLKSAEREVVAARASARKLEAIQTDYHKLKIRADERRKKAERKKRRLQSARGKGRGKGRGGRAS